jgi:hypothetical protein
MMILYMGCLGRKYQMQTGLEYYWAYMEAVNNWAKKWLAGP